MMTRNGSSTLQLVFPIYSMSLRDLEGSGLSRRRLFSTSSWNILVAGHRGSQSTTGVRAHSLACDTNYILVSVPYQLSSRFSKMASICPDMRMSPCLSDSIMEAFSVWGYRRAINSMLSANSSNTDELVNSLSCYCSFFKHFHIKEEKYKMNSQMSSEAYPSYHSRTMALFSPTLYICAALIWSSLSLSPMSNLSANFSSINIRWNSYPKALQLVFGTLSRLPMAREKSLSSLLTPALASMPGTNLKSSQVLSAANSIVKQVFKDASILGRLATRAFSSEALRTSNSWVSESGDLSCSLPSSVVLRGLLSKMGNYLSLFRSKVLALLLSLLSGSLISCPNGLVYMSGLLGQLLGVDLGAGLSLGTRGDLAGVGTYCACSSSGLRNSVLVNNDPRIGAVGVVDSGFYSSFFFAPNKLISGIGFFSYPGALACFAILLGGTLLSPKLSLGSKARCFSWLLLRGPVSTSKIGVGAFTLFVLLSFGPSELRVLFANNGLLDYFSYYSLGSGCRGAFSTRLVPKILGTGCWEAASGLDKTGGFVTSLGLMFANKPPNIDGEDVVCAYFFSGYAGLVVCMPPNSEGALIYEEVFVNKRPLVYPCLAPTTLSNRLLLVPLFSPNKAAGASGFFYPPSAGLVLPPNRGKLGAGVSLGAPKVGSSFFFSANFWPPKMLPTWSKFWPSLFPKIDLLALNRVVSF